jgi:thiosulfate dehydrogenase (quinone) large subunit
MEAIKRPGAFAQWRLNGIGLLRILFGIVWGIDAWFKWQPDFVNNFTTYLTGAQDGQPWPIHHWIQFWVNTVGIDPTFFAYATAVGETAIAIALIVGAFSNLTTVIGVLLSVVIWSTAEGFGGPYHAGSTDVGAAIIYPLVFAGLFLSSAGLYYGLDRKLTGTLGRFGFLASGGFVKPPSKAVLVKPLATH